MNVLGDQSFRPFLWDGDSLKDLGTFGGDFGSADWINEAGEVVGWTLEPDQTSRAFLWRRGALANLGLLPGCRCSIAYVINSKTQVVGGADDCQGNNPRAFIWQEGSLVDLNDLVQPNSDIQLIVAVGLNDHGEIAAQGVLPNGDLHAFLLIPCDEGHPDIQGCDYSPFNPDTTSARAKSIGQPITPTTTIQFDFSPTRRIRRFHAITGPLPPK